MTGLLSGGNNCPEGSSGALMPAHGLCRYACPGVTGKTISVTPQSPPLGEYLSYHGDH
jgi:hypothetical protein